MTVDLQVVARTISELRARLPEADQQPWCPEFDGQTRVSSLQTDGRAAGPARPYPRQFVIDWFRGYRPTT